MKVSDNIRNLASLSMAVRPAQLFRLIAYAVSNRLYRTTGLRLCSDVELEFTFGMFRVLADRGDLGTIGEIFCQRPYETFSDYIPDEGDTCLDVGANIGCVSLQWRRTNKTGVIIAVEPHPVTVQRMRENFALNRIQPIECLHAAIGSTGGQVDIIVDEGKNSMARVVGGHLRHIKPFERSSVTTVPCITIDAVIAERRITRVDLLKIDVEGYEVECLLGASAALEVTARVILEYHSEELKESCRALLSSRGFECEISESLLFARNRKSQSVGDSGGTFNEARQNQQRDSRFSTPNS